MYRLFPFVNLFYLSAPEPLRHGNLNSMNTAEATNRMEGQRVPILVYHHVYPDGTPESEHGDGAGIVRESEFQRHLHYMVEEGWTVVSTSQIVDWLTEGEALPKKAAALHFDNGWLDTATVVLPILSRLGMIATCFPITDGIEAASEGKSTSVRTLTEGVIEKPFMNWDQAQLLLDAGWEIGAHTATHCKMADQYALESDEAILREVQVSNDAFKKHLGSVPEHFAYPSGSHNVSTDRLLSRYYRSLRLWHFEWPITWTYTHFKSSPLALECQNIDMRVSFDDFTHIFSEAFGLDEGSYDRRRKDR